MTKTAKLHNMESMLANYPIFQYGFLNSSDIKFSDKVRHICETECERFGATWSCPPAVGSIESCKAKCLDYETVLLFTTLSEIEDPDSMAEVLSARKSHEIVVADIYHEMEQYWTDCLALSSCSCDLCDTCSWPDAPCRYPKQMFPCIESHGILVVDAAEKCGMDFTYSPNILIWFGMIFFHRKHK